MNMQDILGRVLQGNMTPSGADRLNNAVTPAPGADRTGLGGMFDAWATSMKSGVGAQGVGSSAGGSGILDNLGHTAKDMLAQAKGGVQQGNPLAIGGLAALAGAIFTGGGSALRGAVGAGALAVLAKVAYDAMQNKPGAAAPAGATVPQAEVPLGMRPPQTAGEEQKLEHRADIAVRAMIAAAKADGRVDDTERRNILDKVRASGADGEALRFIEARMAEPLDVGSLVAEVDGKEEALQVYAASLLGMEADTQAEQAYLNDLSRRLGLDLREVERVHVSLGIPQPDPRIYA